MNTTIDTITTDTRTHGGARPGAGRKPKSAINDIARRVAALESERATLEQEQERLRGQESGLVASLRAEQTAVIEGDAKAVEQATSLQVRLESTRNRAAEIEDRLIDLAADHQSASHELEQEQAHQRNVAALLELARSSGTALTAWEQERARVDEFLAESGRRLREAKGTLSVDRSRFEALVADIAPDLRSLDSKYADLEAKHRAQDQLERLCGLFDEISHEEVAARGVRALRYDVMRGREWHPFDEPLTLEKRRFIETIAMLEGMREEATG